MDEKLTIVGILADHRAEVSPSIQEVLSGFGMHIMMRAGVPVQDRQKGVIALIFTGGDRALGDLVEKLEEISGVLVRTMSFS